MCLHIGMWPVPLSIDNHKRVIPSLLPSLLIRLSHNINALLSCICSIFPQVCLFLTLELLLRGVCTFFPLSSHG
jgi:hypothetical protein